MPVQKIGELKEKFVNQLTPLKIYLFGSFANGTYAEESDFDFNIIAEDKTKNLKDLTTQAYRSIRKIKNRPVDIIIGTAGRFEDRKNIPSVENEVLKKEYCYINQEVKQWIDMAEMDYGVAKHLFVTYYPKPYGVAVRYPSKLFLEERHCSGALKMTKEIIDWGKSVIVSKK